MIAAAGSGERLGAGGPKAFVPVAGRPMIEWSIRAITAAGAFGSLVVAAPPGAEAEVERAVASVEGAPPAEVVPGGATRADSVRAALAAAAGELTLIHDAARPLATAELFAAVVERLDAEPGVDAVIAAARVRDTVKRSREPHGALDEPGAVDGTEPRERLWLAQTPQGFRSAALRAAQERAERAGTLTDATDEAALIEWAGGTVLLEPAPAENFKVTTAEDLRLASLALAARTG